MRHPVGLVASLLSVTLLAGCAKATFASDGGVPGNPDLSGVVTPDDLSTTDLAGVDLVSARPDLSGFDLRGRDLSMPPCTILPQGGCFVGEKCVTDGAGGTACVNVGPQTVGTLCFTHGNDDCQAGLLCTQENTSFSQCRAFCAVDGDCPTAHPTGTPASKCLYTLTGATEKVCTVPCNPVLAVGASGCATGLGCQVFGSTPMGGGPTLQLTDCATAGAGGDSADCTTNGNDDCAAGFTCISVTSGSTTTHHCRGLCRLTMNGDCASGNTCITPASGTNTYGFCCPAAGC